jgi:hypothetical protein
MKLKIIVCALLAVLISSPVFAIEIYKGNLLDHKVIASPGIKAGFAKVASLQTHRTGAKGYFAHSYIKSATVKMNEPVLLANNHDVYAYNDSNEKHQYEVFMMVCAQLDDDMSTTHCVKYSDIVELQSGGYLREDVIPQLSVTYVKPGIYGIDAESGYIEIGKGKVPTIGQANGVVIVS